MVTTLDPAKLLRQLEKIGITSWAEPLLCLPTGYQDFSKVSSLSQAIAQTDIVSERLLFRLRVVDTVRIHTQPKKRLTLNATDGVRPVQLVTFNGAKAEVATWRGFTQGTEIFVCGVLQNWGGLLQIVNPSIIDPEQVGCVKPQYYKRKGVVASGALYEATRYALQHHIQDAVQRIIVDCELPEDVILQRTRLSAPALRNVILATHAPQTEAEGLRGLAGMRRLAAFSVIEKARRMKIRATDPASQIPVPDALLKQLIGQLPFALTRDQTTALHEIVEDLRSDRPMRRVLNGDVGCGKTTPIMLAALATQHLDKRAVILTPNVILAEQFVSECKGIFGGNAPVVTVTGTTKKLELAGNPIVVGTTALLSRLQNESLPDFLIVDEEQKLSVAQKQALMSCRCNYLQATATPIPRTSALVTHGAVDVSIIREMPVNKCVQTYIVEACEKKRLFMHTQRVLEAGGQVAVVYPLVDDEAEQKRSVTAAFGEWERQFPGLVSMVHGQMKEADKLEGINALKSGKKKIAVVSSVIEIGVTLGALRSLVVVSAERYGTSTLHQLRGRLARHGGKGHFFMYLPSPVSQDAMARLQLLVEHTDGFALAEKDAELRGYGDLVENSERQSGVSQSNLFFFADLTPALLHAAVRLAETPVDGAA